LDEKQKCVAFAAHFFEQRFALGWGWSKAGGAIESQTA
jgi:hypothetical protein